MDDEATTWHRKFAGSLFNDCWDLIEQDDRDADDDAEMLLLAAASRWHWAQVGGPEQIATGDWQVAHVASLLGLADLALLFAERNLSIATAEVWSGWRLASAHEAVARAAAAAGNPPLSARCPTASLVRDLFTAASGAGHHRFTPAS